MITPVSVESPHSTPEKERAAREETLRRLYEQEPSIGPPSQLDELFAIEEAIHGYFVKHLSPQDLTISLEILVRDYPFLKTPVGDETLVARCVKIAKGEVNFPNPK